MCHICNTFSRADTNNFSYLPCSSTTNPGLQVQIVLPTDIMAEIFTNEARKYFDEKRQIETKKIEELHQTQLKNVEEVHQRQKELLGLQIEKEKKDLESKSLEVEVKKLEVEAMKIQMQQIQQKDQDHHKGKRK